MKKIYNKLVRDNIPDIIASDGKEYTVRTLSEDEYKEALCSKLCEEAEEVGETKDKGALIKEIGDVQEVISSLISVFDLDASDIAALQEKRRVERGGFEKRLFLESVDE